MYFLCYNLRCRPSGVPIIVITIKFDIVNQIQETLLGVTRDDKGIQMPFLDNFSKLALDKSIELKTILHCQLVNSGQACVNNRISVVNYNLLYDPEIISEIISKDSPHTQLLPIFQAMQTKLDQHCEGKIFRFELRYNDNIQAIPFDADYITKLHLNLNIQYGKE